MNNSFISYVLIGLSSYTVLACTRTRSHQAFVEEKVVSANMTGINDESNLEFRIQTDNSTYNTKGTIFLKMTITNGGDSSIIISKRLIINDPTTPIRAGAGETYLIITSPSDDTLSFDAFVDVVYPNSDDFIELKPGETVRERTLQNINEYYDFSTKGEYRITAYYYNYFNKGITPQPWQGKIKSNTIVIQIQ